MRSTPCRLRACVTGFQVWLIHRRQPRRQDPVGRKLEVASMSAGVMARRPLDLEADVDLL
jgi:hypothetical protein